MGLSSLVLSCASVGVQHYMHYQIVKFAFPYSVRAENSFRLVAYVREVSVCKSCF